MAGVCQVFESQVLAVHHKISATEKRRIVINLVGHPEETFLSGALLIRGKDLYKRLVAMAKPKAFKTKPTKEMSKVAMKVGLPIHQMQCDDENCLDCPVWDPANYGDLKEEVSAATELRNVFEICSMHNRRQTEEHCELSKKRGVVKKSKRKGVHQLRQVHRKGTLH